MGLGTGGACRGRGDMVTELAELSLNSMVGISSSMMIKLVGYIGKEPVVVLIDSGASNQRATYSKVMPEAGQNWGVRCVNGN